MARSVARGGLDTHVWDALGVVKFENLQGMVLAGHSYGTVVITGVADRVPVAITISISTKSPLPALALAPVDSRFCMSCKAANRSSTALTRTWMSIRTMVAPFSSSYLTMRSSEPHNLA